MDKKQLNRAMNALITRLEKTEKFVLDQAPEICKQMISERVIECYTSVLQMLAGAFVALLFIAGSLYKIQVYHYDESRFSSDIGPIGWWILGGVALVAFVACLMDAIGSLSNLLIVKKCPKLYLVRQFRRLLK